ncbi:MAG: hypothetical protein ACP5SP_07880 [Caldisericum sp.]|uniref:hypothetical protein n=1 Tax=Caldisericum sp. TaxID=2499687 RepID=UPI003D0F71DC
MTKMSNTYSEFIYNLHLKDLNVLAFSSNRKEDFLPPAKIQITKEAKFENANENKIKTYITYSLSATQKDKKEPGLTISITYVLTYESKVAMTDEHFQKFAKSSLLIETWPYFRNFVNEATMLMGLPPLVLEVLKSGQVSKKRSEKI